MVIKTEVLGPSAPQPPHGVPPPGQPAGPVAMRGGGEEGGT